MLFFELLCHKCNLQPRQNQNAFDEPNRPSTTHTAHTPQMPHIIMIFPESQQPPNLTLFFYDAISAKVNKCETS